MTLPRGIRQCENRYVVDVTVKGIRRTATTALDLDNARSAKTVLRADFSGGALATTEIIILHPFLCSASEQ